MKKGLLPSYACEDYGKHGKIVFPMICFCDIPLSHSAEHIKKYGSYGIGLSKQYLVDNLKEYFGPILYVRDEHLFDAAFNLHSAAMRKQEELDAYLQNLTENKSSVIYTSKENMLEVLHKFKNNEKEYNNAVSLIGFCKQYKMLRKGKWQINYDECEWRYVYPENGKLENSIKRCEWFWNVKDMNDWKKSHKKILKNSFCLNFSVDHINYILVPTEEDVEKLSNEIYGLKCLCGMPITDSDKLKLQSKIMSFDKVKDIS